MCPLNHKCIERRKTDLSTLVNCMKLIILAGMPATGKTTIAAIFRNHFGFPVLEKDADILLFQETKTDYEKMDKKFLDKCGYEFYFLKGESARTGGLATFTKEKPRIVKRFFKESSDALGRASVLDYGNLTLIHVYAPAGTGNKSKLNEKLDFFNSLLYFAQKNSDKDLIIAGDFNIAHKEEDISDLNTKVTFTDEEREALDKLESYGFVDSFRLFEKEEKQFTS